jgi:hypothetical protein
LQAFRETIDQRTIWQAPARPFPVCRIPRLRRIISGTIAYRTDPAAIAAYLPQPLAPGPEPDLAYVAFSRWWSLWDNQPE